MTGDEFKAEFMRRLQALDSEYTDGDEMMVYPDLLYLFTENGTQPDVELVVRNRTTDRFYRSYDEDKPGLFWKFLDDLASVE